LIENRCPTFSWSGIEGANAYELVVYQLGEKAEEPNPLLQRRIPGAALGWTPNLDLCLERGGEYAWSVRAMGKKEASAWSPPSLFQVASGPSEAELEKAVQVVRQYLATQGGPEAVAVAQAREGKQNLATPVAVLKSAVSEQEGDAVEGLSSPAPGPLAAIPLDYLGISSVSTPPNAVAVRGQHDPLGGDNVVGYLGVGIANTSLGEFDGIAALTPLSEDEIGVLGVSANNSVDNLGVVGVAVESAVAGRFFNTNEAGTFVTNNVLLGSNSFAIDASGPVRVASLTVSGCPSGTHSVGSWCIGPEQTARDHNLARENCWDQGKKMCPLDAILACDKDEPAGADCTTTTDLGSIAARNIWSSELDDSSTSNVDAFGTVGAARAFLSDSVLFGMNRIDWWNRDALFVSYCCTER